MKRTRMAIAASLGAIIALSGCAADGGSAGDDTDFSEAKELQNVSFQVNFSHNGTDAYVFYGLEQGYFEDEGIDLEVIDGRTAQLAVDSVVSGAADIGRTTATNIILSAAQGQNVVSVGSVVQKSTFGFMIPEGKGDSFADLSGMEVLTVAGGPNNSLAPVVLTNEGVDPSSITLTNVNPAALLTTYAGGQGDAILTSIPFGVPVVEDQRPSAGLYFADAGVNIPDYSYVVSPEFLDSNPDLIAAFLRAAQKSFDEAVKHPEDAVEAISKVVPTVPNTEASKQQFLGWDEFRCNAGSTEAGPEDPEQWQAAVDIFKETRILTTDVDPTTLYTNRFYEDGSVKASAC